MLRILPPKTLPAWREITYIFYMFIVDIYFYICYYVFARGQGNEKLFIKGGYPNVESGWMVLVRGRGQSSSIQTPYQERKSHSEASLQRHPAENIKTDFPAVRAYFQVSLEAY